MRTTARRRLAVASVACSLGLGLASCGSSSPAAGPTTTAGATSASTAPEDSVAADTAYYTDLATADPALSTYVDADSKVALRALLTDGVAFCDFLYRGGGVDKAMISVAAGASSDESATHLPRSIRTFNAIDSAALIALCPAAQRLLPPSDQASIRQLSKALAASQPALP
jgi:hypothetical protein